MNLKVKFRVLLTGTPLQNNLQVGLVDAFSSAGPRADQSLRAGSLDPLLSPTGARREFSQPRRRLRRKELTPRTIPSQSVLNFILPEYFEDAEDALRAIFKVSTNQHANLLSKQRVSRAQKMMRPFVLRRRKDQVSTSFRFCTLS